MPEVYKKGQGVLVRRITFWLLALIVIWGSKALYNWLIGNNWGWCRKLLFESGEGFLIPVFDQQLNVAFLCTWSVAIGGVLIVWKFLNRQKSAEFLIETDAELRKVTWPSWKDAWNSSMIVLVFVVLLAAFLVVSDGAVGRLMSLMLG